MKNSSIKKVFSVGVNSVELKKALENYTKSKPFTWVTVPKL